MADNIIDQTKRDGRTAAEVISMYEEAKTNRSPIENDCRMAAAYCLPIDYPLWLSEGATVTQNRGASRRVQYDTTGTRSLPKYVSVLERLATPSGSMWHKLKSSNPNLNKIKRVREYFDTLNMLLFSMRMDPAANFRTVSNEVYQQLGVYGNGPVFVTQRKLTAANRVKGFKYISCNFRDVFFLVDDEGNIVAVFRRMWLNVRQFKSKFKDTPFPTAMQNEASKPNPSENQLYEVIHFVALRGETYTPDAIDARRHAWTSNYLCVQSKEFIGKESGYASNPYKIPRTASTAGNPYGYSPAVQSLAALGSASQMKKTYLKQGNRAVDPVLLAHDDGVLNGAIDLRPGAVNYGALDSQGRKLVQALDAGNFQVAIELLQDERRDIEDSFFVTLFQILQENPEMTATEVVERSAEKAALLSPTLGRLQTEFLGPLIERELDILAELGLLPDMPPELQEAQGEYELQYTSPMAKSVYAEETSGFTRSFQLAMEAAQATQDLSPLDHFDLDIAIPEISSNLGTPERWMRSAETIKSIRDQRAQAQQQAAMMQNASGLAAAAKVATDAQQGGVGNG